MAGKSHIYNCCSHERSVHCHVWFSEGRLGSLAGKERWPLWTSSHPLGCLGEDGVRQPTWDTKGDPPKKYKLIGTSLWGIYIYIYICIFYVYIYKPTIWKIGNYVWTLYIYTHIQLHVWCSSSYIVGCIEWTYFRGMSHQQKSMHFRWVFSTTSAPKTMPTLWLVWKRVKGHNCRVN